LRGRSVAAVAGRQCGLQPGGGAQGLATAAGQQSFSWENGFSGSYAWDATAPNTGGLIITLNGNRKLSCVGTNGSKAICIDQGDTAPAEIVVQK
jgi:hypothetical protein